MQPLKSRKEHSGDGHLQSHELCCSILDGKPLGWRLWYLLNLKWVMGGRFWVVGKSLSLIPVKSFSLRLILDGNWTYCISAILLKQTDGFNASFVRRCSSQSPALSQPVVPLLSYYVCNIPSFLVRCCTTQGYSSRQTNNDSKTGSRLSPTLQLFFF